ncbi:MAG: Rrf2 family transcriptional regulator [Leptolyngbyaceae cyanobacterium SL_7_1]|nr:Rrf2 family transcriptional regulator [Leptolyngbyaceae cyanobacterium SL_7_1]
MELSCKSEYALLALVELGVCYNTGDPLQIRQIAADQHIPDRYLEQLLATLRRCGLVRSQRGAKGGYLLAREPWKITLFEVVNCIEGADVQPDENQREPRSVEGMVIWEVWQETRQAAEAVLQRYTLQDLVDKRDARRQLDIMYYI